MTAMAAIARRLPWRIRSAEWTDPCLVVAGDGWSLTITCPWRVVSASGIVFSSSSAGVEDRVWDLIGAEVLRIDRRGSGVIYDPVLVLSGGLVLELFGDTGIEPWVLRAGDSAVIVGPHA